LVSSTVKAAGLFAAGQAAATGLISGKVATLTEEVMKAMFFTKLKIATAVLVAVALVLSGISTVSIPALQARPADRSVLSCDDTPQQPEVKTDKEKLQGKERPDLSKTQFQPEDKKDTSGPPIRSLLGHKQCVTSVAYSPDGKWVATTAFDGKARIWDATTGKEERCLDVQTHPHQIMFSPDNEFIVITQATVPGMDVVAAWSRRTGEKVREFTPSKERAHASGVCAAFSPDGKHLACGGSERSVNAGADILIYEFATGQLVRAMRGQQRVSSR
jgi:hypothetical protein